MSKPSARPSARRRNRRRPSANSSRTTGSSSLRFDILEERRLLTATPLQFSHAVQPLGGLVYDSGSNAVVGVISVAGETDDFTLNLDANQTVTVLVEPLDVNGVQWKESDGGNGHYYALTNGSLSFLDAEAQAVALGGHLVSVNSAEEQAFIEANFLSGQNERSIYWIGANDLAQEGVFEWTSGELFAYSNWGSGEPNNYGSGEDAVHINYPYWAGYDRLGTWNDASTTLSYVGLIELPAGLGALEDLQLTASISRGGTGLASGAAVPGGNVMLQTVAAADAGSYQVTVGAAGGTTGAYQLRIILNSAQELESDGGPTNDTALTAQDLSATFIDLGAGTAERGAVWGRLRSGGTSAGDVFVTELDGKKIDHLDSSGRLIDRFSVPADLLYDVEQGTADDLYVSAISSGSGQLLHLDFAGNVLGTIALPDGNYYDSGLDVSTDGSFWVTQPNASQLLHLDSSGTLLNTYAFSPGSLMDAAVRGDGQVFVTSQNGGVWRLDPATGGVTKFADVSSPYGLNFAPNGDLTVGTFYDGTQRFDSAGNRVQYISGYSNVDAQVDAQNNTWTASLYYYQVAKYAPAGNYLASANVEVPRGLAVIGVDGPAPTVAAQPEGDYYSLALGAGQSLTLAVTGLNGRSVTMRLEDAAGSLLTVSTSGATNAGQVISDFVAPAAGTYYVRVSGTPGADYSLVATRNASFDIELNDDLGSSQLLNGTDTVLGYVANDPGPGYGSTSADFNIGGGGVFDPSGNQLTGTLDEVAIWDVALSAAQIQNMVNAALADGGNFVQTVQDTSPIGYWRFNEPSGDTAVNQGTAGSSLDGTYQDGQRNVPGPDQLQGQPLLGMEAGNTAYTVGPGESFVNVDASPLNGLREFSLAAWVKREQSSDYRVGLLGQDSAIEFGFISPNVIQVWTPLGGQSDYYFSDVDLPSDQWFHVAAVGDGSSLTIYINGQPASYGGYSITPAVQDTDSYRVEVNAGDNLFIYTETPGGDPQQPFDFHNQLDPTIELYDPQGNPVAADDNSALDGKNATISHTALVTGAYQVRVLGPRLSRGEYVLHVDGATGGLPEFTVKSTDPSNGGRQRGPTSEITVDFNDALLLTSLQAADLTVNGIPALGVTVDDANTATFQLPALSEGNYSVQIATGAIQDLQGTPIAAYQGSFYEDLTAPRIIASSIQQGDTLTPGTLVYTVDFSESMAVVGFDSSDFDLHGNFLEISYSVESWSWNASGTQLTLNYSNLPQDAYKLTLFSGNNQFEDLVGFDLDGERLASPLPPNQSGNGSEGGNFSVDFVMDVTTVPYATPLEAVRPLGSLVYDSTVLGVITTPADSDSFTLSIDPGQTITVVVDPGASLQPKVELFRVEGQALVRLGSATAGAAGQEAVIQTVRTAGTLAGLGPVPRTYQVTVNGLNATQGRYDVQVILNAAVETENHNGALNDSRATAQDLTGAFVALNSATANGSGPERAAVLGRLRSGAAAGDVFVTELYGSQIDHLDSTGQVVDRISIPGGYLFDVEQGMNNDLYVTMRLNSGVALITHLDFEGHVLGTIALPDGDYWDAGLDVAVDGSIWVTQRDANQVRHLDASGNLLTTYAFAPGYPMDAAVRNDGQVFVTSQNGGVWQLDPTTGAVNLFASVYGNPFGLNFAPGGDLTVATFYDGIYRIDSAGNQIQVIPGTYYNTDSQVDPQNNLWSSSYYNGATKYDSAGNQLSSTFLYYPRGLAVIGVDGPAPAAALQPDPGDFYSLTLSGGQSISLALSSLQAGQVSFELQDATGVVLAKSSSAASGADQAINDFLAPRAGKYFVRVAGELKTAYNLVVTRNATMDTAEDVLASSVSGAQWLLGHAGSGENVGGANDMLHVTLAEKKTLEIQTFLPGSGSGDLVNNLDPMVQVYDPAGNPVAYNDNGGPDKRNAKLNYSVPAGKGGTYTVEVLPSDATASPTQGDYILSIKGATGALTPFQVVSGVPVNGSRLRGPTPEFTVDFNDTVLLTTLQASDLTVNGVPAVSVSVVDGNTAVFGLAVLGEGTQNVAIAAGAIKDVQGTSIAAFSSQFYNDITAPRVIASSVQQGDVLPVGDVTITVTMSEAMRIENLDTSDFQLQGTVFGGTFTADTFSYDATGKILTLHYSGLTEDAYSLTLFSGDGQFEDQVGFNLDGEANAWPIPSNQSGNGTEGGNFVVNFDLDVTAAPYPTPLMAKPPLGSLIYDPSLNGRISFAGDTDTYTLDLDANQTVTVLVEPAGPRVEYIQWKESDGGNGHYYVLTSSAGSFWDAEADAVALGGHMVSVNSAEEQTFLETAFLSGADQYNIYWFGANDVTQEGIFEWTSGEPFDFTNWSPGQPDNYGEGEDFGQFNWQYGVGYGDFGGWNDGAAGYSFRGLLELPATFVPPAPFQLTASVSRNGVQLGSTTGIPGGSALLNTVPAAETGTYSITVGATGGTTGSYQVRVVLNSAEELESHGGPTNDTRQTAQDIDGSFIDLGAGTAQRGAVQGRVRPGGTSAGDVFTIDFDGNVNHFDSDGRTLDAFSYPNAGGYFFDVEQGIHDDLYVGMQLYSGTGQLLHLDFEGNLLETIVLPGGSGYGQVGLDVASDGSLWVTQAGGDQVHHLEASGNLLATYSFGFLPNFPQDVAVRSDGQVFVNDFFGSVWQLDPTTSDVTVFAQFEGAFNGASNLNFTPEGDLTVSTPSAIYRFDGTGNLLQLIPFPGVDVEVDLQENFWALAPSGYLFKIDSAGSTVFSVFNSSGSSQLAVIGGNGLEPSEGVQPEGDYFSLTLDAGQSLTFALKSLNDRSVSMKLEDAGGTVLAVGVAGATNIDQVISDYVAPATGTYYVRVSGSPEAEYSLVATRDASFDTENNDDLLSAQSLNTTGVALGYVSAIGQLLGADSWSGHLLSVDSNFGTSTVVASNVGGGRGYTDMALNPVTGILYGASECCGYGLYTIDTSTFAEAYVGDLGGSVGAMAWSPDGTTLYGYRYSQFGTIDPATAAFTVINDPGIGYVTGMAFQPDSGTLYLVSGDYFGSLYTLDPATGAANYVGNAGWYHYFSSAEFLADGTLLAGGGEYNGSLFELDPATAAPTLIGQTVTYYPYSLTALEALPATDDYYSISVQAGDALVITTATPGGGAGEFVNTLDPQIELIDPSGSSVASDDDGAPDGRNALLSYTALQSGTYYVRVSAAKLTQGEYVLDVTGTALPAAVSSFASFSANSLTTTSNSGAATPTVQTISQTEPVAETIVSPLALSQLSSLAAAVNFEPVRGPASPTLRPAAKGPHVPGPCADLPLAADLVYQLLDGVGRDSAQRPPVLADVARHARALDALFAAEAHGHEAGLDQLWQLPCAAGPVNRRQLVGPRQS